MLITPPGATPIQDLSELKIPITTQKELDAAEFDNIHRAEQYYFRKRRIKDLSWFNPCSLQQIHKMEKDHRNRKEYLQKLREADQGNFSAFIEYLKSLSTS